MPANTAAGFALAGATAFADAGLPAFHGGGGGWRFGRGGTSDGGEAFVAVALAAAQLATAPRLERERLALNPQAQLSIRQIGQSPDPEEPDPSPGRGTTAGRGLFTPPLFTIDGSASNSAKMSLQSLLDP